MEKIIIKIINKNILFENDEEKESYLAKEGYLEEEIKRIIKEITKFENDILYWSDKLWKISSRMIKLGYKATYNKSINSLTKKYPFLSKDTIQRIYVGLYWRYK